MEVPLPLRTCSTALKDSTTVFLKDVGSGLLEISHNTLAFVGLTVVAASVLTLGRADTRLAIEEHALGWLQARNELREASMPYVAKPDTPNSVQLAKLMTSDPEELSRQQALAVTWLSRRYRVAPEPIARLAKEAWVVGERAGVDPTLILAMISIESRFNPFAQSPVGAQGLMQVMTNIHEEKYEAFGGNIAAFDPVTNLRVGVQVLKECISRAGGLQQGLKYYVGAANLQSDGGYASKVLGEQSYLKRVIDGQRVSPMAPALYLPMPETQVIPGDRPSVTAQASVDPGSAAETASVAGKTAGDTPGVKRKGKDDTDEHVAAAL